MRCLFNVLVWLVISATFASASPFSAGKLARVSGTTNSDPTTDPNWSSVKTLLHFDGSDGSTTITDSSTSALTYTANGSATISTSASKFGGSSLKLDGGGYVKTTTDPVVHCNVAASTWTIEMWIYRTGTPNSQYNYSLGVGQYAYNSGAYYWGFGIRNDNTASFLDNNAYAYSDTVISLYTWTHIAAVSNAGVVTVYVNGVAGTHTLSSLQTLGSLGYLNIGSFNNGSYPGSVFPGLIDDLKITDGVAVYTSNFTPRHSAFPNS